MTSISDSFLHSLVAGLDDENTIGVTMGGSFARGEGGRFSDVDLRRYIRKGPADNADSMRFVNDILVSVYSLPLEDEAENLHKPHRAIWTIPGLRQARILLDKDGSIAALIAAAMKVDWRDLQPAANDYISHELCGRTEEIHKVLDGLERESESKTIFATWGLSESLAKILLVRHGVLVPTENVFIDLAQATAGRDSNWSRQFRLVIGLDTPPVGELPYHCIGIASLRLYRETVSLMRPVLHPDEAIVIDRTLDVMKEAGY